jgi:hypothetical protein
MASLVTTVSAGQGGCQQGLEAGDFIGPLVDVELGEDQAARVIACG